MRVLLDTHAFLWFIEGKDSLSIFARRTIEDETTERFVSIASLWEAAIKFSIGKLDLQQPFATLISRQLEENAMALLPIRVEHLTYLTTLPFHHRDPFDRLLIVQAMVENMPIISTDEAFDDAAMVSVCKAAED
jgi:PIN domain nuclease of toxin-antitoxin system